MEQIITLIKVRCKQRLNETPLLSGFRDAQNVNSKSQMSDVIVSENGSILV